MTKLQNAAIRRNLLMARMRAVIDMPDERGVRLVLTPDEYHLLTEATLLLAEIIDNKDQGWKEIKERKLYDRS